MKIRRSTMRGITLAILMLASVSACTQPATNTNGAGTAANANAAKPAATTTAPAATTAAGSLSTPTNAFMAFYEASKKNDVPGVMRTLSKDSLDFLTAEAKKENKTLEVALAESLKNADIPATPELRNEKIDGDKATIEAKSSKSNDWDTLNFVRENNEWKIKLGVE